MAADSKTEKTSGFFAKLKARLNRGTSWLASDLLGLSQKPLDEATIEDLETWLLTADVGVSATEWLIGEMRREHRRAAKQSAAETLAQTAPGLLAKVEAPLSLAGGHRPFVILVLGVNGTGKTTTVGKLCALAEDHGPLGVLAAADTFLVAAVRAAPGMGPACATCR